MAKRYLSERPIVSSVSYRHKEFKAVVWDGKGTALAISQHCDEAALQCLELTLFSLSGCGSGRELALLDDAALPRWGKGALRVCGATLFAPAGQRRFRVGAPDFGRVAGESGALGRFAHQERLAGAPGERKARSDSCRPRF